MEESNIFDTANLKDGFAGDRKYFKGFLAKMELIFLLYPERFLGDEDKVVYIISRLYGQAMNWAATLIEKRDPCLSNYEAFIGRLKSFFGNSDATYVANQMLRSIHQKNLGGIQGYILEFNKYADESNWNEEAKMDAFIAGLNNQVATKIIEIFPGPRSLIALQTIASRIDARLSTVQRLQRSNPSFTSNRSNFKRNGTNKNFNNNKNKQFHGRLSKEEKEYRRKENLCLYCGSPTHAVKDCPKRTNKNEPSSSTTLVSKPLSNSTFNQVNNSEFPQNLFNFTLGFNNSSIPIDILVDSGSCYNLIDETFVKSNNIPTTLIDSTHKIRGIGGIQTLALETIPVTIKYSNHRCITSFYVTNLPSCNCILGFNWLKTHNPSIDFTNMKLSFDSNYCNSNCLVIPSSYPVTPCEQLSTNKANIKIRNSLPISNSSDSNSSDSNSSDFNSPNSNSSSHATDLETLSKKLPKELSEYLDVFNEAIANVLPPHRPYNCEIKIKEDGKLFYGPVYPLTAEESVALEENIKENLAKGFIRKSKSPAGAPVLFVKKKNGNLRMVVDYRRLNEITIRDSYPLPLINDMLENLGKGNIFSKLDLKSAYNLIRIKSGDEYKTAFTCKLGHFEYTVMPFGLKNAPAVFQHFINDVFEDIIGKFVYCYIDDIIIFSSDYFSHVEHIKEVLSRLRNSNLVATLEKCEFFVPYIDFLGHRISAEGINMDPSKVSSILNWPVPKNVKELQSFLGLANYYRRFIPGFAKLAHPLHKLLRKNVSFKWCDEQQEAFDSLKHLFTSAPVLIFPNVDLPFEVETDSSNFAIGAILSQVSPSDNKLHPIAYFSRSLLGSERNYPIYDKELLAIVDSLEHWRHLLKGTSKPFTIFSDHRNLLFQKKPEKMTQRLVRWSLFLSEFNFIIKYRSGSSNGKPDSLSRRPDYASTNSSDDVPFTVLRPENFCAVATSISSFSDEILSSYKSDEFYINVCNYLDNPKSSIPHPQIDKFTLSNSFLLFNNKIYIPPNCRSFILKICHDSPSAGHFGIKKTSSLISRDFWWPSLNSDVVEYVRSCDICARSKSSRHKPYGFLKPLAVADRPWSSISMDYITDLPSSNGFTCILVVIDRLTKMGHFIAFAGIPSAEETAIAFINGIFCLHGLPSEIISDRGSQFTSKFWKAVCQILSVDLKFSSPFHHQTNGQTERVNSVIEQYLRCFSNYKGTNWNKFIKLAEFSYNNAIQESAKQSPFFLNYGYHPRYSLIVPSQVNVPRAEEFTKNLNDLIEELKINIKKANEI